MSLAFSTIRAMFCLRYQKNLFWVFTSLIVLNACQTVPDPSSTTVDIEPIHSQEQSDDLQQEHAKHHHETPFKHLYSRIQGGRHLRKDDLTPRIYVDKLSYDWSFDWVIEPVDKEGNQYVYIRNRSGSGVNYLKQNPETRSVYAAPLDIFDESYQWLAEPSEQYIHLKNRLTGYYLRADFGTDSLFSDELTVSWGFDWRLE